MGDHDLKSIMIIGLETEENGFKPGYNEEINETHEGGGRKCQYQ